MKRRLFNKLGLMSLGAIYLPEKHRIDTSKSFDLKTLFIDGKLSYFVNDLPIESTYSDCDLIRCSSKVKNNLIVFMESFACGIPNSAPKDFVLVTKGSRFMTSSLSFHGLYLAPIKYKNYSFDSILTLSETDKSIIYLNEDMLVYYILDFNNKNDIDFLGSLKSESAAGRKIYLNDKIYQLKV